MSRKPLLGLACSIALIVAASNAFANSVDPMCGSCQGSTFSLTYSTIGPDTFQIRYTVDTSGYTGPGTLLDDIAFRVSTATPTGISLVSAPGGTGDWTIVPGNLSATGCTGSGKGTVCVKADSLADALAVPDGTYTWVIDLSTLGLFTGMDEAIIKARYTNRRGRKVGPLASEHLTLQAAAEPAAVILVGAALVFVLAMLARRPPA